MTITVNAWIEVFKITVLTYHQPFNALEAGWRFRNRNFSRYYYSHKQYDVAIKLRYETKKTSRSICENLLNTILIGRHNYTTLKQTSSLSTHPHPVKNSNQALISSRGFLLLIVFRHWQTNTIQRLNGRTSFRNPSCV